MHTAQTALGFANGWRPFSLTTPDGVIQVPLGYQEFYSPGKYTIDDGKPLDIEYRGERRYELSLQDGKGTERLAIKNEFCTLPDLSITVPGGTPAPLKRGKTISSDREGKFSITSAAGPSLEGTFHDCRLCIDVGSSPVTFRNGTEKTDISLKLSFFELPAIARPGDEGSSSLGGDFIAYIGDNVWVNRIFDINYQGDPPVTFEMTDVEHGKIPTLLAKNISGAQNIWVKIPERNAVLLDKGESISTSTRNPGKFWVGYGDRDHSLTGTFSAKLNVGIFM